MTAYKLRVKLVPLFDILMLCAIRTLNSRSTIPAATIFWMTVVASTALSPMVDSMQVNAQLLFSAQRVDPEIGGKVHVLVKYCYLFRICDATTSYRVSRGKAYHWT